MSEKIKTSSIKRGKPARFPLFPLRDMVIFPHMVVPLFVGREKSIHALEAAMNGNKYIFLATQKNAKIEDPKPDEIFTTGTICHIIQLLKLPDGTVKVLVEGKKRGSILSYLNCDGYFAVEVADIAESSAKSAKLEALVRGVRSSFERYAKLTNTISAEVTNGIAGTSDPSRLADTIATHLNLKITDKQDLLDLSAPLKRLEKLLVFMESEIEILQIENRIHSRVKKQMEKAQKDYYLNEQMRAIQKELGNKDDFKQELALLEKKIAGRKMSAEATEKALSELKKLKAMSPASAEAAVIRNYLDWVISIPWNESSAENVDLATAETILDADHFGLEKVKERILEYLAVTSLVTLKGPILCLVGPPGVGKTSLVKSVARATGRKFVKMSLGGVRDEAEIRGHRRTYVGAMPGKIIQNMKRAGTTNPVFLLDEIDKMSADFRGDPASALLEVLDPEQNATFNDHFLDLDYDLSKVMFVTTANSLHSIPRPLLDRLEVIRLEGYLEMEKLAIAKQYLVKKQLTAHGLDEKKAKFTDKAILDIIRNYTREAGVRNLEREIATICRKTAHAFVKGKVVKSRKVSIADGEVRAYLGVPRFRYGLGEENDGIGVVTGLAWTEVGGDLLKIEVATLPGKGKMIVTGKLGEVMQESAQAAMTYVRSRALMLGLELDFYQSLDIHIHVPEGAIPKDGPSAGITMATAIISALTKKAVRNSLAMTGEITLLGRVLAIGGLKEKLLAARRGLIKRVLIPEENEKDLVEMPKELLAGLDILPVRHMDDVILHAFVSSPLVANVECLAETAGMMKTQTESVTSH
ncbi:endopeptidase La [Geotalea sp. SG265]|uniref:endopeptidase La n=1 Tax=Geotalea sp. SG265 TaxID=2922867 RepID=UPI001FAF5FE8|nr:endopeptidase La [Geotalea sp. SG265]